MRKIRKVLRLKYDHKASARFIANSCGISRSIVADYLQRAIQAQLSWPLPEELDDTHLEQLLFKSSQQIPPDQRPLPDWEYIQKELRRKNVTRFLLWQEYKTSHPEGLQYIRFCSRFVDWRGRQDLVMRQDHKAGEKMFVDYAGQQVPIINRQSGEAQLAEIFVAVLGARSYAYCEAN